MHVTPNQMIMLCKNVQAFLVAGLLFTVACKKDDDGGNSPTPAQPASTLTTLFQQHVADATQEFNLDAAAGGTVMGAQGTRLVFDPSAFLHADGSTVTGMVEVHLVEVLRTGDMIWMNKRTVGNDAGTERIMRSGGELKIGAFQGSEELRIVDNGVTIKVPTSSPDPNMQAFVGTEDLDGTIIWDPMDSTTVTIDPDTSSGAFYTIQADSLQWINYDYFASYPNTTNISATTPMGQPNDSTMFWIAFPTENIMMSMYGSSAQTFTTGQIVPVGMNAVVIGLYRDGTNYYSSFNPVTISAGMTVPTTFIPTTLAQFGSMLDAL